MAYAAYAMQPHRNPYREWNVDREAAFAAVMEYMSCVCSHCTEMVKVARARLKRIESTPQAEY